MIQENLNSFIKEAMFNKDEGRLRALRMLKGRFTEFLTAERKKDASGREIVPVLDEEAELKIVNGLISSYKKEIRNCESSPRRDAVKEAHLKEMREELAAFETLVPKTEEVSEADIMNYAVTIVKEKNPAKMGLYIKDIRTKFAGVDGKLVADIVKDVMSSLD